MLPRPSASSIEGSREDGRDDASAVQSQTLMSDARSRNPLFVS